MTSVAASAEAAAPEGSPGTRERAFGDVLLEVTFEDGRRGTASADLKIVDAKTFPAMKRAA